MILFFLYLLELALDALEDKRENPSDHIINMPEFNIDSNIGAVEFLEEVIF